MARPNIDPVKLEVTGRSEKAHLPSLLEAASRSTERGGDQFLPPGYLQPTATVDVSAAARGGAGATKQDLHPSGNEIVVLELADGGALVTTAAGLHDALARTRPDLVRDGAVLLGKLRAEAGASRGLSEAVGGLIRKVFTLVAGEVEDAIIEDALKELRKTAAGKVAAKALLGVSWAGTRALMAAIESRLDQAPGLYRWVGSAGTADDLLSTTDKVWWRQQDVNLEEAAPKNRMLVFVHGTGSSTLGSFGDLRTGDRDLWGYLERHFTGGIFAFEHYTLSQSPIDNALMLADLLPRGAHVSFVSHSRGGLVADLLCLGDFTKLIDGYRYAFAGTGDPDEKESARVKGELEDAHATQREELAKLSRTLLEKELVVERYVRVASPANGTKLASANFDVFLSGLLTLIGYVPFFFGNPYYSAFKRVVIELVKNRTDPHLVPGIEAMLPDSPMAVLLREAPLRAQVPVAVIAGDSEGGHVFKRLGTMLTDFLVFDRDANDLVVNTSAMLAGVAPQAKARVLFDRGGKVSHFRYFTNFETRAAVRDWLVAREPEKLDVFRALPMPAELEDALAAATPKRGAGDDTRPVVVLLPAAMGSHLQVAPNDRVWFDPPDVASGGLAKIAWGQKGVEAEELFGLFYGELCKKLSTSHRVERFPYDWRQPLDVLGERLGQFLDRVLDESGERPVRLLAHGLGGLVVRACIHERRPVMDRLMQRKDARLVMMGVPNQGTHSMVENLLGKGDTVRTLARLHLAHDVKQLLTIVAGFPGMLQLLPRPGFTDTFQGQEDGGAHYDYQDSKTWEAFKKHVTDPWFGDGNSATPEQAVLDAGSWLWNADDGPPALPADYEKSSIYVFGIAPNTPCGVREDETGRDERGDKTVRLRMVGTSRGDGTVTWDSGRIGGIGSFYYMPAAHGDLLLATDERFPAIVDLLTAGVTARLATSPPAVRAAEEAMPVHYDAGPPSTDDPDAIARSLLGASVANRIPPRPKRRLEVAVRAMDLRFVSQPIMVGHYEHDPIAGPEAVIDREVLAGDLRERYDLGLYAGPRGTAAVVLRVPNESERQRGSLAGAVVTGLGRYDGALSLADLTESVRTGALRYLLQVVDILGKDDRAVPLATLLLGYNSSANLTIAASVEALVRGVMEANARFHETTRLDIRIGSLDIIELYLDTAISAVYSLRQLTPRLQEQAEVQRTTLACKSELDRDTGVRQRLFDAGGAAYWPRLVVTDADRNDDVCPPECYEGVRDGGNAGDGGAGPDATGGSNAPGGPSGGPPGGRRTLVADRLRFLYVGQRARAESVLQQRQPGLVERLVRQQIHVTRWLPDFGRMLFQLMVPHDLKDTARQLDRVVLVVDSCTANVPWELLLGDDPSRSDDDTRPLALRTAVVRQLSSTRFRRQVRQVIGRTALVIGNPSVEGFAQAFPAPPGKQPYNLPELPGAQGEAEAVHKLLGNLGYDVQPSIGEAEKAADVLAKLYRKPWRVLHISAHGIFDMRHRDRRARSGVVLSDGLLITAAEIAAMEVVPELVFMNCCHLGQVEYGRDGNKLAASVARELIDIGVRCVVVAGWAVTDGLAQLFGQTFYEHLLLQRRPFGEAVLEARKAVWARDADDITWGAFQAYGDPGWLAEPRAEAGPGADDGKYASPEELLDHLASLRAGLAKRGIGSDSETQAQVENVDKVLRDRCPPGWVSIPQAQSALGSTWFDLGQFDKARAALLQAVQAVDQTGLVPIRDIELLANAEARLGEKRALAEMDKPDGKPEEAEKLIDDAIRRVEQLDALVSTPLLADGADVPASSHGERSALRGGAWKRKASLWARRLITLHHRGATAAMPKALEEMTAAIDQSVRAYGEAEGVPGGANFSAYQALNRLALDALTAYKSEEARAAAIALARHCNTIVTQSFARRPNIWDAGMQAESLLVECLIDESLQRDDDTGRERFDGVVRAYAEALSNVTRSPAQLDSIVSQMEVFSRFYDALAVVKVGVRRQMTLTADRLLELARRLQPERAPRSDRPVFAPPAGRTRPRRKSPRRTT